MNKDYFRVGIYLRLSQEDKDKINKENDSESIKNQRNMLMDYIDKHKEFIFIDEYCDEDLSGAGTYRPQFERLIKDCENKKIDIVLCKSQSRFSRDMEIVEKYINNKFKEWNIRFIGISDNADTNVIGNKKARQINGLVNEWYLEDVSNNIRSAFNSKMRQGEFISPFAAFGYEVSNIDNNKLLIDPIASEIVKKIFNLYLKGLGYLSIAKYLNDKNIPSPSLYKYQKGIKLNIVSNKPRDEIKWNSNAIKTISYKNHKVINKSKEQWIKKENTHEPIIDKETFKKVNEAIKSRKKVMKKGNVHIFSGKVFCLECKSYMRKKNSSEHEYLVCSNNCCINKKSIRYDKLYDSILNEINKKIDKYYDEAFLNNELNKKENKLNILYSKKNEILKKINKNKEYFKSLYEDKVNNIITIEQFNELNNSYNNKNIYYNNEIKEIDKEIKYYKENKNKSDLLCKYKKFNLLNRIIIEEFIDKIYVGSINNENCRTIAIKWNF